jgi:hypothetical protein
MFLNDLFLRVNNSVSLMVLRIRRLGNLFAPISEVQALDYL